MPGQAAAPEGEDGAAGELVRGETVGGLLVDRAAARGERRKAEARARMQELAREREVWNKRHENVRAQMAAVVERTLEEKRKLQLQKDRPARQQAKARRQPQLDLGAARLAGNPKRAPGGCACNCTRPPTLD